MKPKKRSVRIAVTSLESCPVLKSASIDSGFQPIRPETSTTLRGLPSSDCRSVSFVTSISSSSPEASRSSDSAPPCSGKSFTEPYRSRRSHFSSSERGSSASFSREFSFRSIRPESM